MSTTATKTFAVGDQVTPDAARLDVNEDTVGVIYTVVKVNRTTVTAMPEDENEPGIQYSPELLVHATDENTGDAARRLREQAQAAVPKLTVGMIVTITQPYKDVTTETPLVVVKVNATRVHTAVLGGGAPGVNSMPWGLIIRDIEWLREQLAVTS